VAVVHRGGEQTAQAIDGHLAARLAEGSRGDRLIGSCGLVLRSHPLSMVTSSVLSARYGCTKSPITRICCIPHQ
jgi:hypothetical protein